MSILSEIADHVAGKFGVPSRLTRFLADRPGLLIDLKTGGSSFDASKIVRWDEFGETKYEQMEPRKKGELQGFHYHGDIGRRDDEVRWDIAELSRCEITKHFEYDLRKIDGFSGQPYEFRDYQTIEAYVRDKLGGLKDEHYTPEGLKALLEHHWNRIILRPETARFDRYLWDGRVFVYNGEKSNYLAAAILVARELGQAIPLKADLHVHSINGAAVESLCNEFQILAFSCTSSVWNELRDAINEYRAPWKWSHLPDEFTIKKADGGHHDWYESVRGKAIFLPRTDERSMEVARLLRLAGFADLGAHLKGLVEKQERSKS